MQQNLAIDHRILMNLDSDSHTNNWLPVIFLLIEIVRYKSQHFLDKGPGLYQILRAWLQKFNHYCHTTILSKSQ